MKSKKITVALVATLLLLIGFGIGQIFGIPKAKPKYDCMRSYYAGMDMEFCTKSIKCTTSEDETGTLKICRDETQDGKVTK